MVQEKLDNIVNSSPSIEAALQMSKDGLPLLWNSRYDAPVEEIASIATGLFSMGFKLELLPKLPMARLSIETDHGSMVLRELPDATVVLALAARNYPIELLEIKVDEIFFAKSFT